MILPFFYAHKIAMAIRHGSGTADTTGQSEVDRARSLVIAASTAMRDAAIAGHFEQFGYLRGWITEVATA